MLFCLFLCYHHTQVARILVIEIQHDIEIAEMWLTPFPLLKIGKIRVVSLQSL